MDIRSQAPPEKTQSDEAIVSSNEAKQHFVRNSLSNIIYFVFNATTSFFMVPYVIHHVGIANYGMITLANSFVSYTQVLTIVLVSALFRFVTAQLALGDISKARSYLNTQYISIVCFTLVVFPLTCLLSYYAPDIFIVPRGQDKNTQILFLLMYGAFFTSLLTNPFKLAQFAKQRFYLGQWIDIIGQVLRYGTWVILFFVMTPSIWQIGLGYFGGAVLTLVLTVVVFRRLMPDMMPSLRGFEAPKFFEMSKLGGWMVIDQVGTFLALSIDVLIINRILGPSSVGKYGTVLGLVVMLKGLSSTMSGMVTPLAVASYATRDFDSLTRNISRASKFVSMGMSLPLGALCGLSAPFLAWWLGPEYAVLAPLVWWLLSHMVITCGVEPMWSVSLAANKMALPSIVDLGAGIVKVVIAIVLMKYTNLGMYGAAIAGFACFVLKYGGFTPWYTGHLLERSGRPLYAALLPGVAVFGLSSGLTLLFVKLINIAGFMQLAVAAVVIMALTGVVAYRLVLNAQDRAFLNMVVPWKRGRASKIENA